MARSDTYQRAIPRKTTTGTYSYPWRLTNATRRKPKYTAQNDPIAEELSKGFATITCSNLARRVRRR